MCLLQSEPCSCREIADLARPHAGSITAQVMMMLVPEAWQNDPLMPQEKKDFYLMLSALVSCGSARHGRACLSPAWYLRSMGVILRSHGMTSDRRERIMCITIIFFTK